MNIATVARATASSLRATLGFKSNACRGGRSLIALLCFAFAGAGDLWAASAQTSSARGAQRVILKPKRGDQRAQAPTVVPGAKIQRIFRQLGDLQVIELPAGISAQAAASLLKQSKLFEYTEPDQIVRLRATPNDFRFGGAELWNLNNTGQLGGTPGADIKAVTGWDIRHDASNIIVALVDSGVRLTHEDIAANLWRNPREIAGNGIDDDGNGVIDDVHGFNAWLDNGNPADDIGHGTHVAGTIGAVGNNVLGVTGVAWKVQLMATKFTDANGEGTVSDAIACIDYARQMGAQVINASWGAPDLFNSTALRDAIAAARDAGIVFVTVAGNNQGNNDAVPYYPGAFDLDNIVVVTATNRNDQLAWFANYGATTVDLGAPGDNIFSTWVGHDADYQYYSGGSMAVAHVSGAAALVRAQFPGDSPRQVIRRILEGTDPLPSLLGRTATGGRLNLFKALGGTTAPPTVAIAATDASATEAGDTATFTVTRTSSTTAPLTVLYTVGGTAANGVDYAALPGTLVIPAGASSTVLVVQTVNDTAHEGSESVMVTLTPSASYAVASGSANATVTIADDDPAPLPAITVVASDANAAEGGDTGAFTITRANANAASPALTIAFGLSGTATNGTDYRSVVASATIPAGAASVSVIVTPIDDMNLEGNETVVLTLASGSGYTLGAGASATVTLADDDRAQEEPAGTRIAIRASSGYALELGWPRGEFTVSRQGGPKSKAITVNLTVGGTATANADYQRLPASVTIPAGKNSVTVSVVPVHDRQVERTETVVVSVAPGAGYEIAGNRASATVHIVDDDWLWEFLRNWFDNT
jgi:subtilisin family serine protease